MDAAGNFVVAGTAGVRTGATSGVFGRRFQGRLVTAWPWSSIRSLDAVSDGNASPRAGRDGRGEALLAGTSAGSERTFDGTALELRRAAGERVSAISFRMRPLSTAPSRTRRRWLQRLLSGRESSSRDAPGHALGHDARRGADGRTASGRSSRGQCTSARASRTCRRRTATTASSRRCCTTASRAAARRAASARRARVSPQMAVFALVAKETSVSTPPACGTTPMFADVPVTSPYCRYVEELARRGVTSGCGGGNFCPTAS